MRSVFMSPRLESVEKVARLLEDAGIEVRVTNDRSYKGNRRRPFSYREGIKPDESPQVWVIKAEDQPKARAMLREAGLIEDSKRGFGGGDPSAQHSFLPASARTQAPKGRDARASIVLRVRIFLLAAIVMITILTIGGWFHR